MLAAERALACSHRRILRRDGRVVIDFQIAAMAASVEMMHRAADRDLSGGRLSSGPSGNEIEFEPI